MKFQEFIGIDVSKSQIDVVIYSTKAHATFDNDETGFANLIAWIQDNVDCLLDQILFAFEHTGLYSLPLSIFLSENNYDMAVIPGLELKRSLGITRGKNDKVDAKLIAQYAYEKVDNIKLYQMPSNTMLQLKRLLSYRERLVKEQAAFKARLGEYKTFLDSNNNEVLWGSHQRMIGYLDQEIKMVENELYNLIKKDKDLFNQYKLINTIKGVGPNTALTMIVLTNGFTQFENWRKFATYAGTAPFSNESGKFKGRTKISNLANKKIKALLSCCANSAIEYNPEIKMYFQKRMEEGKNKMSTINIVRNKLLSRIFAVVSRGTPYVNTSKYAG